MESQEAEHGVSQYFCNLASFRNYLLGVALRSMGGELDCSKSAMLMVLVWTKLRGEIQWNSLSFGVRICALIHISMNLGHLLFPVFSNFQNGIMMKLYHMVG